MLRARAVKYLLEMEAAGEEKKTDVHEQDC
jgi:hypothetical protein